MKYYLINNTRRRVPKAFFTWLIKSIVVELQKNKKHQKFLKRQVGVVLVDAKEMSGLNQKYRGKEGPTDVLSFESEGDQLGDVVICLSKVAEQAKEHELAFCEELSYMFLHGMLHLLGYDHETTKSDAKKMFNLQDKIFEVLRDKDILRAFKR